MSATNILTRPLTSNQVSGTNPTAAGTDRALALRLFSGEVMSTFEAENIMLALQRIRSIPNGRSASFPVMGQLGAFYMVPGSQIGGSGASGATTPADPATGILPVAERVINIDHLLVSGVYISDFDEKMAHYDTRSPISREIGNALRRRFEQVCQRVLINTARAVAALTGTNPATGSTYKGGSRVTNAAMAVDADVLRNAIITAARYLDDNNVAEGQRYANMRPVSYYSLLADTDVLNKDWGGSGSLASGKLGELCGVKLIKSNQFPTSLVMWNDANELITPQTGTSVSVTENTRTKDTAVGSPNYTSDVGSAAPSMYTGDFTKCVAAVFTPDAIGTVKLMDIRTDHSYEHDRKSTLLTSDYAMGHNALRPECAVELATA